MPNFTDLPRPKRTHRLSIVAVWNEIEREDEPLRCEHPTCQQHDWDIEEVTECPCCGRWMCWLCFHPFAKLCPDCSKLTDDERQAVMALREKLGGAM